MWPLRASEYQGGLVWTVSQGSEVSAHGVKFLMSHSIRCTVSVGSEPQYGRIWKVTLGRGHEEVLNYWTVPEFWRQEAGLVATLYLTSPCAWKENPLVMLLTSRNPTPLIFPPPVCPVQESSTASPTEIPRALFS